MRRKRFSALFYIVTLCLCLCVVAVGVYSLKKAQLDINGTIKFESHDCDVFVNAVMDGGARLQSSTSLKLSSTTLYYNQTNNLAGINTFVNVHEDKLGWSIGDVYFDDISGELSEETIAQNITVTINMYNASYYPVYAVFNGDNLHLDSSLITAVCSPNVIELPANQTEADAITVKVTFSVQSKSFKKLPLTAQNPLMYFTREKPDLSITMPNKGDLIYMNLGGDYANGIKNTYRVLKTNGTTASVVAMFEAANQPYHSDTTHTTTDTNGKTVQQYNGSDLDKYLNETWYNSLDKTKRTAILASNITQYSYTGYAYNKDTHASRAKYSSKAVVESALSRYIYALDLEDIEEYFGGTAGSVDKNTQAQFSTSDIFILLNNKVSALRYIWFRSADAENSEQAFCICGDAGYIWNYKVTGYVARPAFNIDLQNISWREYVEGESYLAADWKAKVCTNTGGSDNGFCTADQITSVSFVDKLPTNVNFVQTDGVDKCISIGANNTTDNVSSELETGIVDVKAYAVQNSESRYSIYIYSPVTIYLGDNGNAVNSSGLSSSSGFQFSGLKNVTSFNFSNLDTSKVTNMTQIFSGCSSLTNINLSNFNTANVTNMDGMFWNCSGLTKLNLKPLKTSNVLNMSNMFSGLNALTSLDLSTFDTSKVTDMNNMFYSCSNLESINLSSFNTSLVTNMSNMFASCSKLISLNLSSFDALKVTDMSYMFASCYALTTLNLSSFNASSVTNIYHMFSRCINLTSLDLSSFNASKVTDMSDLFKSCSNLESINLSSFNTSLVTNMSNMFIGCSSLTSLDLSSFDTSSVNYMSNMFNNCSSLISLDLSSFDTSSVNYMSYMFNNCSSLISLDLSSFDTSQVTNMEGMFNTCSKLTSLDLSSFDTSQVTNMNVMFGGCSGLENLNISSFNVSKITYFFKMLSGCSALEVLYAPYNVSDSITLPYLMYRYYNGNYDTDGYTIITSANCSTMEDSLSVAIFTKEKLASKGQLITLDLGDNVAYASGIKNTYRVLKMDGNIATVVAMFDAKTDLIYGSTNTYANSNLDVYLNTTWYNTLDVTKKKAIVGSDITQYSYSGVGGYDADTHASYANYSTKAAVEKLLGKYIYALDIEDIEEFFGGTAGSADKNTAGKFISTQIKDLFWNKTNPENYTNLWLRSKPPSNSIDSWIISAYPDCYGVSNSFAARPAFRIDLTKASWEEYVAPTKGDLITMDLGGDYKSGLKNTYRILKINDDGTALVMAMFDASTSQKYHSYTDHTTIANGKTVQQYNGSDLDTYLNTTWYGKLNAAAKSAIVASTITQYSYDSGTYNENTHASHANYSSKAAVEKLTGKFIYALDVEDIEEYFGGTFSTADIWSLFWDTTSKPPKYTNIWLRSANAFISKYAWYVIGYDGFLASGFTVENICAARPAFKIDLSKIDWSFYQG